MKPGGAGSGSGPGPGAEAPGDAHPNQFALLRQRRFAPFFWTQFLGAANDNLFKFGFTVLVTYQWSVPWLPRELAGLVISALFILPFVLLSATSGQLADRLPKHHLMRWVKLGEVGIMAIGLVGFLWPSPAILLLGVMLMGVHSTVFGPVKFAYLPATLNERELVGGNGVVEMGTFVAILLGNLAGGLLVSVPGQGPLWVGLACLAVSLLGVVAVWRVPPLPASAPGLRINWNPVTETVANLRMALQDRTVFRALLGISWMWFFGAVFLSQFPVFARDVLHGSEGVASLLLVLFSVGVGAGSLLCETLSRGRVEVGLVIPGALGMTVFSVDLYFATRALPAPPLGALLDLGGFVAQAAHWRVMADLALMSLFTGLYIVPLYAMVQSRSPVTHRARIIAANNILNALYMIASALIAGALMAAGLSLPQLFGLMGLANLAVTAHLALTTPEYLGRLVARCRGQ